uniref:(northern house mosquito) hypothetical protein n=1 Tax=Culex pipiens TaxID=7175 RepID=A0A8D8M9V7_CULPI
MQLQSVPNCGNCVLAKLLPTLLLWVQTLILIKSKLHKNHVKFQQSMKITPKARQRIVAIPFVVFGTVTAVSFVFLRPEDSLQYEIYCIVCSYTVQVEYTG